MGYLTLTRRKGEAIIIHDDEGVIARIEYVDRFERDGESVLRLRCELDSVPVALELRSSGASDNLLRIGVDAEREIGVDREEVYAAAASELCDHCEGIAGENTNCIACAYKRTEDARGIEHHDLRRK